MLALPGATHRGSAWLTSPALGDRRGATRRELSLLRGAGALRGAGSWPLAGNRESLFVGTVARHSRAAGSLCSALRLVHVGPWPADAFGASSRPSAVCVVPRGPSAPRRHVLGGRAAGGAALVEVAEGRRPQRPRRPALAERLYLDVAALAVSGLVYWAHGPEPASRPSSIPDSNPTLSLLDLHVSSRPRFPMARCRAAARAAGGGGACWRPWRVGWTGGRARNLCRGCCWRAPVRRSRCDQPRPAARRAAGSPSVSISESSPRTYDQQARVGRTADARRGTSVASGPRLKP